MRVTAHDDDDRERERESKQQRTRGRFVLFLLFVVVIVGLAKGVELGGTEHLALLHTPRHPVVPACRVGCIACRVRPGARVSWTLRPEAVERKRERESVRDEGDLEARGGLEHLRVVLLFVRAHHEVDLAWPTIKNSI